MIGMYSTIAKLHEYDIPFNDILGFAVGGQVAVAPHTSDFRAKVDLRTQLLKTVANTPHTGT